MTHVRVTSVPDAIETAVAAGGTVVAEPVGRLALGQMAVLSDPIGAIFAVSEADTRCSARLVNESRAWALSTLWSSNVEASEHFYATLFGWRTEAVGGGDFRIFRLAGYIGGVPDQPVPRDVVAVMQPLDTAHQRSHWEIDFWIDNVDLTAAKAAALGGVVMVPPQDTGLFRYALIADRQGATFTVSRMTIDRTG